MFRISLRLALAAFLVFAWTATTQLIPFAGASIKSDYSHAYRAAQKQFGKRAPGRNILRFGLPNGKRAKKDDLARSLDTLNAMLHPAPAPKTVAPQPASSPARSYGATAPTTPSTNAQSGSGGGGCNGMSAESGSAGYSSGGPGGHFGCYQIGIEHYNAGGSCEGLGTDPAGQDACAKRICQTEGASAWTNSAGQNPCGRLGG